MAEGGRQPRNKPPTVGTKSVDFYHYPVTVWAYSMPQPNTEVPVPTGGAWASSWVNNQYAGDLRCHRTHYDANVIWIDASANWAIIDLDWLALNRSMMIDYY